ncbi:MAG: hypothetical protein LBE12_04105 [Planctomycetaceae bacterium]|nr:hypothetical protein [Planctomycetaceae bacterium]
MSQADYYQNGNHFACEHSQLSTLNSQLSTKQIALSGRRKKIMARQATPLMTEVYPVRVITKQKSH